MNFQIIGAFKSISPQVRPVIEEKKKTKSRPVLTSKYKVPKLIHVGSTIKCADNTGAKTLKIIGFKDYQGARKRRLSGGVGSIAVGVVTKGPRTLQKKWHYVLIIRQKYPFYRKTGAQVGKVRFTDNAGVLLERDLMLKKSVIKGPVARQVCRHKAYSEMNVVYK